MNRQRVRIPGLALGCSVAFLVAAPATSGAAAAPPDSAALSRLCALGRIWGEVTYFHPSLGSRAVDWDSAVVASIPRFRAASTAQDLASAARGLLAVLGDPATNVVESQASDSSAQGEPQPHGRWTADSILVVTLTDYSALKDFTAVRGRFQTLSTQMLRARAILFDMRASTPTSPSSGMGWMFESGNVNAALVPFPLEAPAQRYRMHSGYPPEEGSSSGDYFSGFYTRSGEKLTPRPGTRARPVTFLVNQYSGIPPVALALQRAGRGAIVAEGSVSDASAVDRDVFDIGEDLFVRLRLGELLQDGLPVGVRANVTIPAKKPSANGDPALDAALVLLRDTRGVPPLEIPVAARATPIARGFPPGSFPPAGYRILAAYKIWYVIRHFFPHRHLLGEDWDQVLRDFIPRMETASDSLEYALAVAEMVTHIHDSHCFIWSEALNRYFGLAPPPIQVRKIEGLPVVTAFTVDSVARAAGVEIGDVIVKVDGEEAAARLKRYARYLASSTPQSEGRSTAARFLNGADGSMVTLTLRGAGGRVKEATLPRKKDYFLAGRNQRTGDSLKVLPGNIGYADLDRLPAAAVDSMFEKFRSCPAIVFDMRGYPLGSAWAIAPRLAREHGRVAARFQRPLVLSPDTSEAGVYSFPQYVPWNTKPRYSGKTVMLIDERTMSQAEHTGLFLEAANDTKFVGSPTAGCNGDATNFAVPGGIRIQFSGHDVRHADGRQLQRIGLKPDVPVAPTIAGIRAGRDEVLERALRYLRGKP